MQHALTQQIATHTSIHRHTAVFSLNVTSFDMERQVKTEPSRIFFKRLTSASRVVFSYKGCEAHRNTLRVVMVTHVNKNICKFTLVYNHMQMPFKDKVDFKTSHFLPTHWPWQRPLAAAAAGSRKLLLCTSSAGNYHQI